MTGDLQKKTRLLLVALGLKQVRKEGNFHALKKGVLLIIYRKLNATMKIIAVDSFQALLSAPKAEADAVTT